MDESPPKQTLSDRNGDLMIEESIFQKCVPSQMNVESSDPCVKDVDIKKDIKTGIIFHFKDAPMSSFHIRCARRSFKEDIKIESRAKKLEQIWKNRGLPVDKETLRSAAIEDVFNMKALNDSLPSASAKKQGCIRFRKEESDFERFVRRNKSFSRLDGTPLQNSEASRLDDLLRKKILLFNLRKTRQLAREKHTETPASDEQKEGNEDNCNSLSEKFFSVWKGQDAISRLDYSKPVSLGSSINYEPDNNELGEKKFGFQMNDEFPPLLIPSSDSEKNLTTDLLSPGLSVPLNSPTKWKVDGSGSASSMVKLMSEVQRVRGRLNVFRDEKSLQILNAYTGVFPEDKDGSECESLMMVGEEY